MIGRLRGQIAFESPTGEVIVDVGGVGYDVFTPLGTVARLRAKGGHEPAPRPGTQDESNANALTLSIHTNIREDAFELYGFASDEERQTFRALIAVHGVGPKLALAVLNLFPESELSAVIEAEDLARLNKVPGVGKKTAERLILELRGKLQPKGQSAPKAGPSGEDPRLIAALTGLGYKSAEAQRAAKGLNSEDRAADLATQIRRALSVLTG